MSVEHNSATLARSRAERYLAEVALRASLPDEEAPPGFDDDAIARSWRIELETALATFAELGLISAAEADEWRRLGEGGPAGAPPTALRETSPRATQLLEELIEKVPQIRDDAADPSALVSDSHAEFTAALTAARAIGELGANDAASWLDRLVDHVLAKRGEDLRRLRQYQHLELADLVRVFPGPARRSSGLILVSVELYLDAILICWQIPYEPPEFVSGEPGQNPDTPEAVLEDDIGTEYTSWSGGGGTGIGQTWEGTTVVCPAPPNAARTLKVRLGDDEFAVDLRAQGESSPIR